MPPMPPPGMAGALLGIPVTAVWQEDVPARVRATTGSESLNLTHPVLRRLWEGIARNGCLKLLHKIRARHQENIRREGIRQGENHQESIREESTRGKDIRQGSIRRKGTRCVARSGWRWRHER